MKHRLRILHLEDEPDFSDLVRSLLEKDGMAVEVLSPARHLRVVVNVLNTNPWADGEHREEPVLDLEQATAIATQPWWDARQLPVEYVAAGERLDLYKG